MKKGFTLIELLAVIVILAIIALIATPIILGIINDAREKANERSVELYASAVRNGIAAYQLTGLNAPKSFRDLNIQYDGDVKCTVQELYADGSFYLEGCKVNGSEKTYSYGTKKGTSIEIGKMSICNPLNVQIEGVYTAGDKYECDVDPNKDGYDQIFYVLTSAGEGATSVNLIMDSNITSTGEAIKDANPTDKGLVAWVSKIDYISEEIGGAEADYGDYGNWNKGPISAMNHLASATAGWTNVTPQTISVFYDHNGDTHQMGKTFIVNARMPYYSEISNVSSTDLYLIDYLNGSADELEGIAGRNGVSGVGGYWTLSAQAYDSETVWLVNYFGETYDGPVSNDGFYGVRPVITLSI